MEVHSHNVMRAFFSEIDDSDEQAFNTTFGVFGGGLLFKGLGIFEEIKVSVDQAEETI